MLYICSSPLVKIFLPEWEDRLQENPELIYDKKTPFEFNVPRASGGVRVKFNTPQQVPQHLARDEKSILAIFNWLTGGPNGTECQETDLFGIVVFDPGIDLTSTYDQIAQLEGLTSGDPEEILAAKKRQDDLAKNAAAKVKAAREAVVLAGEARIKRHMKMTHNNLIRQWQLNEEMKLGKYPPSFTEKMGAFALDEEIKASQAKGQKLNKRMNELMQNQVV